MLAMMCYDDFKELYVKAWRGGCSGITTFRASGKLRHIKRNQRRRTQSRGMFCRSTEGSEGTNVREGKNCMTYDQVMRTGQHGEMEPNDQDLRRTVEATGLPFNVVMRRLASRRWSTSWMMKRRKTTMKILWEFCSRCVPDVVPERQPTSVVSRTWTRRSYPDNLTRSKSATRSRCLAISRAT